MNNMVFKLILSALLLALSIPADAHNACGRLFENKKASPLEYYNPLVTEFFEQKIKSKPPILLTVKGPIQESLEWMKKELSTIQLKDLELLKSDQSKIFAEITKLQEKIKSASLKDKIFYEEYLVLSQRFSAGISFKFVDKFEGNKQFKKIEDKLINKNPELTQNLPEFFFLPSPISFGLKSMNAFQAKGIAILGLTSEMEIVDGRAYLPVEFFEHDEAHARGYEAQPFFNGMVGNGTLKKFSTSTYPILSLKDRSDFYVKFENFTQSKNDTRIRQIYDALWFIVFHETGLPIHPKNLVTQLEILLELTDSNMGNRVHSLLKRLNDKTDLGYSLKEKEVTEEEVIQAGKQLIEFAKKS